MEFLVVTNVHLNVISALIIEIIVLSVWETEFFLSVSVLMVIMMMKLIYYVRYVHHNVIHVNI
jgi:hypothetical protein